MVKRNGKEDPLRKTLLIVDEAHKLYAPGVAKSEKPNTDILEEMIQKSYDVSGNDSVRLLLMTATPYTEDGMEMIKLLNLLRSDKFPSDFDNFAIEYLDENGKFSKTGIRKFQDNVSGYISYLNRSRDARNFAYPIVQNVMVDLSVEKEKTKETNKFDRMNKTLKDEIKEIKSLKKEQDQYNKMILKKCLQDNEADFKQLKQSTNQNQKDELTKCNELSTKERVKCRQNVKEVFAKKQLDIKESNEKRKEDCKQKVEDTVDLNKDLETKYQELDQTIKDKNNFKDKKNSISTKLAQTRQEILQNKLILKDINQKISEKTRQINKIQNNKEKLKAKKDLKNDVLYSQLKEITNNIANYKGRMTSLKAEKKVTNVNANPSKLYNISQEYALEKYCKI
jgi:hypothetical protein